jgi:hypothetical protein
MNDLFATASATAAPAPPPYGSLSHREERCLHDRDRAGWLAYVAPGMAKKLEAGGVDAVRAAWPWMRNDYRRAVWRHLSRDMRNLVEAVQREPPPEPPDAPE